MSSLHKRLSLNLAANVYAQLVAVGYQLLTVPLFLSFWPKELYGEWLVLSALPAYIALSNIGLMNVAGNNMAMAMGAGNLREAKESLHTIWCAQLLINITVFMLLAGVLSFVDVASLLKLKIVDRESAKIAVIVMCLYAMFNMQAGVFNGIYRAVGQNARGVFLGNTIRLLSVVFMGGGLVFGFKSVVSISLLLAGSYALGAILLFIDSSRIAPELRPGFNAFSWPRLKVDIRHGVAFMAYPLGRAFTNQGMLLFVNFFINSSAVVVFSTMRTVVNTVFKIGVMINQSTWPEFSRLYGENNRQAQKKLFCGSTALGIWTGTLSSIALFAVGPNLLMWWTRGEVRVDRLLLGIFLMPIVFNSFWWTSVTIFNATNRHHRIGAFFMFGSIMVPFFAWLLQITMTINLYAVGIGYICMEIFMLFYTVPHAIGLIEMRLNDWFYYVLFFPFRTIKQLITKLIGYC